ncbi:hypothetical protein ACTSKR_07985 [Chitinibacteraceae bacterium HSL-7]
MTITSLNTTSMPVRASAALPATRTLTEVNDELQQSRDDRRQAAKPVAEQVFISRQAQQLFDIYTGTESETTEPVSLQQVVETTHTINQRQTMLALGEYAASARPDTRPQPFVARA